MAFITFSRAPGGKKGAGGAYKNALEAIDLIQSSPELVDEMTGTVSDEKYYLKTLSVLQSAYNNPSLKPSQRKEVVDKINYTQKEYMKWRTDNAFPDYAKTLDALKSNIRDDWNDVWSQKDVLGNNRVPEMVQAMQSVIEGYRDNVQKVVTSLEGLEGVDPTRLETLKDISEYLKEQEVFWRGAEVNPDQYGVFAQTDNNGQIMDLNVVNLYNNQSSAQEPIKMSDYNQVGERIGVVDGDYPGMRLYGRPDPMLESESGEKMININGNIYTGGESGFVYNQKMSEERGKVEPSLLGMRKVPFGNYAKDSLIVSTNGDMYSVGSNGEYLKVKDPDLKVSLWATNPRVYTVSQAEADKLQHQYNVREIDKSGAKTWKETGGATIDPQELVNRVNVPTPTFLDSLSKTTPEFAGRQIAAGASGLQESIAGGGRSFRRGLEGQGTETVKRLKETPRAAFSLAKNIGESVQEAGASAASMVNRGSRFIQKVGSSFKEAL